MPTFDRRLRHKEDLLFSRQVDAQTEAERFNESALKDGYLASAERVDGGWGVALFREPGRPSDFQGWLK